MTQLIDELTPSAPDFQLREACDQLVCPNPLLVAPVGDAHFALTAQHYRRHTRDAVPARFRTWDARDPGSPRGPFVKGRHYEAVTDRQCGTAHL